MDISEALGVISTVCREYKGNLADHTRIQTALQQVANSVARDVKVLGLETTAESEKLESDLAELKAYREAVEDLEIKDGNIEEIKSAGKTIPVSEQ